MFAHEWQLGGGLGVWGFGWVLVSWVVRFIGDGRLLMNFFGKGWRLGAVGGILIGFGKDVGVVFDCLGDVGSMLEERGG